jgi:hypothetical protein
MLSTSKIRLILAALLLVAMFGVTAAPRVHANPQSNSIRVTIVGGNVSAAASCLNAAGNAQNLTQANVCTNTAFARGNIIILRGFTITGIQSNSASVGNTAPQRNSLSFTVVGGNVSAVAQCVNAAGNAQNLTQVNICANTAIAIGNTIVLINVNVTGVQVNS